MLEMIFAGLLVAIAVFAIGNTGKPSTDTVTVDRWIETDEGTLPDLPCPWCLNATEEHDESCPSCGQRFG